MMHQKAYIIAADFHYRSIRHEPLFSKVMFGCIHLCLCVLYVSTTTQCMSTGIYKVVCGDISSEPSNIEH